MAKRKGTDDYGYEKTDDQLNDLEARLSSLYTDASKEMEKKLGEFLSQYQEKDDQQRALVKEGKLTEEEYKKWRQGQIFQTKKMQAQVDNLTETLVNTDKLAMQMVNGELPSVYANNYNFQGYKAEKMAQAGGEDYSSFTIYNADAVARLATKDPDLLPAPRVDIPKDTKWNKTKINTAISQGIIQGEPIDKIASRLIDVTEMDYTAAVRNARTAVIGAQNAGRADASERVKEAGYEMVDVWSATYDQRTRDTHIALDGQERQPDGYFHTFTGELLAYPCDPNGAPEEVYNCRCRLNSIIKGINHSKDDELYAQFMEENYYDDWLVVKEQTEEKKELYDKNKATLEDKLSKKEAEKSADKLSELGLTVTTDIDPEDFHFFDTKNYSYAYQLSQEMEEFADDDLMVMIDDGKNKAYAAIDEESNSLDGIVSTGGGQGTELLGKVMEYQESKGEGLIWLADNPRSVAYYDHLGLAEYGTGDKNEKSYEISAEDMSKALEKVNEHRDIPTPAEEPAAVPDEGVNNEKQVDTIQTSSDNKAEISEKLSQEETAKDNERPPLEYKTAEKPWQAKKIINDMGFKLDEVPQNMDKQKFVDVSNKLSELNTRFGALDSKATNNIAFKVSNLRDPDTVAQVNANPMGKDTSLELNAKYYEKSPTNDPENTTPSSFRVARGGCWYFRAAWCRSGRGIARSLLYCSRIWTHTARHYAVYG